MVYEWVRLDTPSEEDTMRFTCNSAVAIAKGTLCILLDENRVGAHSAAAQPVAGVAAMDKANNDYSTTVSIWTKGRFDAKASGALVVGQAWQTAAQANTIKLAEIDLNVVSGAQIGGKSLATASADETVNVTLSGIW